MPDRPAPMINTSKCSDGIVLSATDTACGRQGLYTQVRPRHPASFGTDSVNLKSVRLMRRQRADKQHVTSRTNMGPRCRDADRDRALFFGFTLGMKRAQGMPGARR